MIHTWDAYRIFVDSIAAVIVIVVVDGGCTAADADAVASDDLFMSFIFIAKYISRSLHFSGVHTIDAYTYIVVVFCVNLIACCTTSKLLFTNFMRRICTTRSFGMCVYSVSIKSSNVHDHVQYTHTQSKFDVLNCGSFLPTEIFQRTNYQQKNIVHLVIFRVEKLLIDANKNEIISFGRSSAIKQQNTINLRSHRINYWHLFWVLGFCFSLF